jgi:hypothetical protein
MFPFSTRDWLHDKVQCNEVSEQNLAYLIGRIKKLEESGVVEMAYQSIHLYTRVVCWS